LAATVAESLDTETHLRRDTERGALRVEGQQQYATIWFTRKPWRTTSASFRSRPAHARVDFLALPDDRFHPVFLAHGPDGALYVVDMVRAVIEHPECIHPEPKDRTELLVGRDRGQIWQIVPAARPATGSPDPT
jgi:hypothetical protein